MKKNKGVRLILISLMVAVPAIALAQTSSGINPIGGIVTFGTIISTITNSIIRAIIALLATGAMAAFFYGIVQYIWGLRDGKEDQIKKGNNFMVYSLVALFVMFSVWGIITYFQRIIGIEGRNTILIPDVQIQTGSRTNNVTPLGTSPSAGGGTGQGRWTCPNGTIYYDQATMQRECPNAVSSGGGSGGAGSNGGAAGGGTSKKGLGYTCSADSECLTGFCDPVDDQCSNRSSALQKGLGYSCTNSSECLSGWCDPADSTCSNPTAAGDVNANGVNCTGISDAETCTSMNCVWNDVESTCGL